MNPTIRTIVACIVLAGSNWSSGAVAASKAQTASPWANLGRAATPDEIKAWDIDVRGDFKGLPPGKGSALDGLDIWEARCASCHGVFAESNEVFTPIVGGTTAADIETGRVAGLTQGNHPHRTTFMKLSKISTLWDYIRRAMPWNAPKSLKPDEVYAVVAYLLSLAEVVPEDFVLSDQNIGDVQKRLPNRNGVRKFEPMWKVSGKPDVQGDACMRDCRTAQDVRSSIPAYARNAHGNLAEQNRLIGPVRGADTTRAAPDTLAQARESARQGTMPGGAAKGAASAAPSGPQLARDSNCMACHAVASRMVGPAFAEVAKRYQGDAKAEDLLVKRVREGTQGTWGQIAMPANSQVAESDVRVIVRWILGGAK
ncbi:MAG: c-type cytochrome [Burkholderiaceae bacterium]|nr:c-type cytochrome [Burkholderiaceae bacterium]